MVECPQCKKVMEYVGRTPTRMSPDWWKEDKYVCRPCGLAGTVETSFTDSDRLAVEVGGSHD